MLESLANIGEFVGAIGVIVTVGYLAVQIRQSTKAVRSASDHRAAEQTWSAALPLAHNPELDEVWMKAVAGQELSPVERAEAIGFAPDPSGLTPGAAPTTSP